MVEAQVTALSAKQGDTCLRDVPRLLTKEEIRALSEIDSSKVMLAFAVEILLVAAAVALSEATWFNPLTYLLAVVVVGTRILGLGGLMHEAAHYRVFRSRALNDFVGELMAFPTTASMAGYRNSHFSHHRELNGHKDPDWTRNLLIDDYEFPMPQYLFLRKILLHLVGFKTRQLMGSFHNNPETREIPVLTARLRLAAFVGLFAASIAFGFWKHLLLYWAVPLLTVFIAAGYLKRVSEHYGVRHEGVLNETRTLIAPSWQLFLLGAMGPQLPPRTSPLSRHYLLQPGESASHPDDPAALRRHRPDHIRLLRGTFQGIGFRQAGRAQRCSRGAGTEPQGREVGCRRLTLVLRDEGHLSPAGRKPAAIIFVNATAAENCRGHAGCRIP